MGKLNLKHNEVFSVLILVLILSLSLPGNNETILSSSGIISSASANSNIDLLEKKHWEEIYLLMKNFVILLKKL